MYTGQFVLVVVLCVNNFPPVSLFRVTISLYKLNVYYFFFFSSPRSRNTTEYHYPVVIRPANSDFGELLFTIFQRFFFFSFNVARDRQPYRNSWTVVRRSTSFGIEPSQWIPDAYFTYLSIRRFNWLPSPLPLPGFVGVGGSKTHLLNACLLKISTNVSRIPRTNRK